MTSRRSSTLAGSSGGGNPLQSDGELQNLMGQLDSLDDATHFISWRKSFVDKLEEFLGDAKGVEKAEAADNGTRSKMPRLTAAIANVSDNCVDPDARQLRGGVKTQMGLNKLKEGCIDMQKRLTDLVPSNSAETQACGYSKYHLGAVLVKNGFVIYAVMMHHEAILTPMVPLLEDAHVDRQILDAIQNYFQKIRALRDVLADLGLYKVMQKTREFIPLEDTDPTLKDLPKIALSAIPPPTGGGEYNYSAPTSTASPVPATPRITPEQRKIIEEIHGPAIAAVLTDQQMLDILKALPKDGPGSQHTATSRSSEQEPEDSSATESSPVPTKRASATKPAASPTKAAAVSSPAEGQTPESATAPVKKPRKKKPSILPGMGRRDGAPTQNTGKKYAVSPPKNPTPLIPVDVVRAVKPPPSKNDEKKKNKSKSNEDKEEDDGEDENQADGDGDDDQEFLVFFDPKTQSMGKIPRQKCIKMRLINVTTSEGGQETIKEKDADHDHLVDMILQGVGRA